METKTLNSIKATLIIIALGVWAIVLQNADVFPTTQSVYVVNEVRTHVLDGDIDADVTGTVGIGNTVDVNVSEINGSSGVFYRDVDGMYNLIGVTVRP